MKKIIVLQVFIVYFLSACAQQKEPLTPNKRAQSLYAEVGGNGIVFSINYDFMFAKKQNGLGARLGLGYITTFLGDDAGFSLPLGFNYLAGTKNHFLEAGVGATFYRVTGSLLLDNEENVNENGILFVPSLGYRYQPPGNGANFRIFISPLIGESSTIWAGLSIGYKF